MKILLIDIETAPNKTYTWGMFNQNIGINQIVEPGYTLCFSAKWYGEAEHSFYSAYHQGSEEMVYKAHDLLSEADAVVHYYGTKFDIPVLNKEFILQGINPPEPYKQIDLIHTVRKQFKFASNKLDYVCQQLGIGEKVAHKGMDLWDECMSGNEESWAIMKEYNEMDVTLLERLYNLLLPWIERHPNHALYKDTDSPVCPNCGGTHLQKRGLQHTFTQSYQRLKCMDCGSWTRERFTNVPKEKRKHVLVKAV